MGLLDGLTVVDFSRVLAGPYCTQVLADLGAEVIKVERPDKGDDLRWWGPPFVEPALSTYFAGINRGKHSIVVDLAEDSGRERARSLMHEADVVVENFRAGTMDRFGLGYDAISVANPGVIYCSITGFGDIGPMKDAPGYDILMQAFTGLMSVTGPADGDPTRVGVAVIDIMTGLHASNAILAAAHRRTRTGRGARLSTSLMEAGIAGMPNVTASYLLAGVTPERTGNEHPHVAPYGVFSVADGQIVLAIGNDHQWGVLCGVLDDDRLTGNLDLQTNEGRLNNRATLNDLLGSALKNWTREQLTASLADAGVPAGPINGIDEVLATAQADALELVLHVDGDPERPVGIGNPVRVDGERVGAARPAPRLGEHDVEH